MLVALGACSGSSAAKKDVTITGCVNPGSGHPTATGRIINHSSKSSLYTIHVKFKDSSGNSVGDGVAAVGKVDAGETASWHATGTFAAKGRLTCDLASVTRHISV